MLAIGQELYQQTDRDLAGLGLEEVNYGFSGTWLAGNTTQLLFTQPLPSDRMLYVAGITWALSAGQATARVRDARVRYQPAAGFNERLVQIAFGDRLNNASNSWGDSFYPHLLLPKGGTLLATCFRDSAVDPGFAVVNVWGYLVPPGNIARGS